VRKGPKNENHAAARRGTILKKYEAPTPGITVGNPDECLSVSRETKKNPRTSLNTHSLTRTDLSSLSLEFES
jgi:hypothetical protein